MRPFRCVLLSRESPEALTLATPGQFYARDAGHAAELMAQREAEAGEGRADTTETVDVFPFLSGRWSVMPLRYRVNVTWTPLAYAHADA